MTMLGKLLKILFVSASFEFISAMKLSETQKKCYVNSDYYEEGEKFTHAFSGSPCKFECTCVIRKMKDIWVPTGSCVHRCPPMSYPPGCEPVSDGCCMKTYFCPGGEKCQDKETGLMYTVGQRWKQTKTYSSCECDCFGEGVGRYQCKCVKSVPIFIDAMEDENRVEDPCIEDDSQSCSACPVGLENCPIRAKCEHWPYKYEGIDMECTCFGLKGTRCVSVRGQHTRRGKRSQFEAELEIYFSENSSVLVEPLVTRIDKESSVFFKEGSYQ